MIPAIAPAIAQLADVRREISPVSKTAKNGMTNREKINRTNAERFSKLRVHRATRNPVATQQILAARPTLR